MEARSPSHEKTNGTCVKTPGNSIKSINKCDLISAEENGKESKASDFTQVFFV